MMRPRLGAGLGWRAPVRAPWPVVRAAGRALLPSAAKARRLAPYCPRALTGHRIKRARPPAWALAWVGVRPPARLGLSTGPLAGPCWLVSCARCRALSRPCARPGRRIVHAWLMRLRLGAGPSWRAPARAFWPACCRVAGWALLAGAARVLSGALLPATTAWAQERARPADASAPPPVRWPGLACAHVCVPARRQGRWPGPVALCRVRVQMVSVLPARPAWASDRVRLPHAWAPAWVGVRPLAPLGLPGGSLDGPCWLGPRVRCWAPSRLCARPGRRIVHAWLMRLRMGAGPGWRAPVRAS